MAMVCLCNGVSERTVRRAIEHGADTVEAVGERCGAGTCCHSCPPTIEAMLEATPVPAVVKPRRRFVLA
jgi:bacterioferritin-associated ferredoxin